MNLAGGRCPECGFDPPTVSPYDGAVAARSYPRRYRAVLVRPDDDDPDIVHRRPAPGEPSAAEHAAAATAAAAAATEALRRILAQNGSEVDLREPPTPPAGPLGELLDALRVEFERLAAAMEKVYADAWLGTAQGSDGVTVTALDAARTGVHAGIHHLRAAERALAQARR